MIKTIIALTTSLLLASASNAFAFSFAGPHSDWTPLPVERLKQLPPAVERTLRAAQKACGDEQLLVRTGYVRYLPGAHGGTFVSLHLDQVHCNNRAALCRGDSCLHHVYIASGPVEVREVWRGYAREIDLDQAAGATALTGHCGDACQATLHWDGRQFGH